MTHEASTTRPSFFARAKKAVVAGTAFAATALAAVLQVGNVLPDQYVGPATAVLAFLATVGVYKATNAKDTQ